MSIFKINAIFLKQAKDTIKNFQIVILYFIYPLIAYIMTISIPDAVVSPNFFITIFASMHMIFTPIVTTSSIISEEKEQNTLKMLVMSNVKPFDYLFGIGSFVFLCTQLGTLCFAIMSGYSFTEMISFVLIMSVGIICSIILGFAIGLYAKNQSSASALTIPFAMILSFLPMLSSFNTSIKTLSNFFFSQRLADLMNDPSFTNYSMDSILIILLNMIIILFVFILAYKKRGLD